MEVGNSQSKNTHYGYSSQIVTNATYSQIRHQEPPISSISTYNSYNSKKNV